MRRLWGWFTARPDSNVVLIDLRETVTVGPVILVPKLAVSGFEIMYRESIFERALGSIGDLWLSLGNGRALEGDGADCRLLAPLEPPKRE